MHTCIAQCGSERLHGTVGMQHVSVHLLLVHDVHACWLTLPTEKYLTYGMHHVFAIVI